MKNVHLLVILIGLIALASFVQKGINKNENKNLENNSPADISQTPIPSPTEKPTPAVIKENPTPIVTENQNSSQADINFYKYPNSQTEESGGNRLVLNSSDDPNKITEWYIEKLKSQNLSVNSFVKTKTNNNVLNKLISSNGTIKVSITISKKNSDTNAKIAVEI